MADIATIWSPADSRGDWMLPEAAFPFLADGAGAPIVGADGKTVATGRAGALPGTGLVSGRDLETAVLISIFTDAVATPDDNLPDRSDDPRGWWGDTAIGSKLWLRLRSKRSDQTRLLVKADIEAALAWMIADDVAAAIDVTAEWTSGSMLACRVIVRRRDGTSIAVAFDWAWKDL